MTAQLPNSQNIFANTDRTWWKTALKFKYEPGVVQYYSSFYVRYVCVTTVLVTLVKEMYLQGCVQV